MNQPIIYPPYTFSDTSGYCSILSTGIGLPSKRISTEDILLENELKVDPRLVKKHIAVNYRHIAHADQCDSDLQLIAVEQALESAQISADDLYKIIVNKYMGDYLLPMSASFLQNRLNISQSIHSFDIDGGIISSFQALDLVSKMMLKKDEYILIASGGIHNRFAQQKDTRHAFLFGDGAGALILAPSNKRHILGSYQITNPHFSNICYSEGLTEVIQKDWFGSKTQKAFYENYHVNDTTVASQFVSEATAIALEKMKISLDDIDIVLYAGINVTFEHAVREGLNCSSRQIYSTLSERGNTMSAALPITIHEAQKEKLLQPGTKSLFVTIGEGLSCGFMYYQW
ncbi:MAG: 3-oxoacyl-[acyl-carrier-protein] synthase III C-terminal domain-containing protein [Spirochaetales bacterium]|nr:3-oxoacyl-[acyl-carrier-protein] synthase III C-terminal domain-containing protein [Spirochaetales bacterium]